MVRALTLTALLGFSTLAFAVTPPPPETDMEVTQRLHQALVEERGLSNEAHYIHIVTLGRKTVLTGKVASAAEKRKIDAIAHAVIGKDSEIFDQLTVER